MVLVRPGVEARVIGVTRDSATTVVLDQGRARVAVATQELTTVILERDLSEVVAGTRDSATPVLLVRAGVWTSARDSDWGAAGRVIVTATAAQR